MSEHTRYDLVELLEAMQTARRRRLQTDFGITPSEQTDEHNELLLGRCHENVVVAAGQLHDRGYEPYIAWGTYQPGTPSPSPSISVEEAEQNGLVHFWAELHDHDSEPIVCEIASETTLNGSQYPGDPLAVRGRPSDYVLPDEALFPYRPSISPRNLRSLDGYELLKASASVE